MTAIAPNESNAPFARYSQQKMQLYLWTKNPHTTFVELIWMGKYEREEKKKHEIVGKDYYMFKRQFDKEQNEF